MSFYVYVHRKASTGKVFYVGKGKDRRAWSTNGRNRQWHRTVEKHGIIVEIVQFGMQEWWAFELERDLINKYGRENLANVTEGGDGPCGYKHTKAAKTKMSAAKTGKKKGPDSLETREKKRIANIGKHSDYKHTDAARKKISAALKQRQRTQETRLRISASLTGKKASAAHRQSLVKSHGGKQVVCITTNQTFMGASDAAAWLRSIGKSKASPGGVSNNCKGRAAHAYGYKFGYVESLPS